nr:MFS transporter [Agromyces seonyuensis]
MGKEFALSIATAAGALAQLVCTPIFGHLSDRTVGRFGRRRPWIVGGVLLGSPLIVVAALAGDLVTFTVCWTLANLGYAATLAALYGMIGDRIPDAQRAKASGIFGAGAFAGLIPAIIIATALKSHLVLAFSILPIVAIVVVLALAPFLTDQPVTRAQVGRPDLRSVAASLVFDPRAVPQFAWVWLQRFVVQFGYMLMGSFGLYYLLTRMELDTATATNLSGVTALLVGVLSIVAAAVCGVWAGRRGNYGPFVVTAVLLLAIACLIKAFTAGIVFFFLANALAGFALGCYYAVDLALVLRIVPAAESGRYLGAFVMAKKLPESLAPALAPFLLLIGGNTDPFTGGTGNYLALYLVGGVLVLASLLPLRRITALRAPLPGSSSADAATAAAAAATPTTTPDALAAPAGTAPDERESALSH